jgi:hypothetical protein
MGRNPMFSAGGPTMKIAVNELKDVTCPKCGGLYFDMVNRIKIIPKLQSPTGEETMMPFPLLRCVSCQHIIEPEE